jgi:hypothetical protein
VNEGKMVDPCEGDPLAQPLFVQGTEHVPLFLVDTSTLIYLDKITMLDLVLAVFAPMTISQVITEFGRYPEGLSICAAGAGETDDVLVQTAIDLQAGVLSEDKKVLLTARRQGLCYYNSLMILLALYSRKEISCSICEQRLACLLSFARYSEKVQSYGRELFTRLVQGEKA